MRSSQPSIPGIHPNCVPGLNHSLTLSRLKLGNRWVRDRLPPPSSVSRLTWGDASPTRIRLSRRLWRVLLLPRTHQGTASGPGGHPVRQAAVKKEQTIITGLAERPLLHLPITASTRDPSSRGGEREVFVCGCLQVEPDNEHNYLIASSSPLGRRVWGGVLCPAVSWWQKGLSSTISILSPTQHGNSTLCNQCAGS